MQNKSIFLLLSFLLMFLNSCQQNSVTQAINFEAAATIQADTAAMITPKSIHLTTEGSIPPGCTVVSPRPTPGPTEESLFPPVNENDWILGPVDADVTIVEYGDFQCVFCAQLAPVLKDIQNSRPEDVRIVYRHYPLTTNHDKALLAAQAAEAAGIQNKFWEFHDALFEKQYDWESLEEDTFLQYLADIATSFEMDVEKFQIDLMSKKIQQLINHSWEYNRSIGIPYTPFLLVNNQIWPDGLPMDTYNINSVVRLNLLERRQFASCPPLTINMSQKYTAIIHTQKGDIQIELFPENAPLAVNNFIFLSENGWYDGVTFHRVIPGFVAQAGDPSGTGYGGPGYFFINENYTGIKFNQPGLLAMANSGPDTNGSQFFITLAPTPHLDGGYSIFGKVIVGMEVVESLAARDPSTSEKQPEGDKILSVEIQVK